MNSILFDESELQQHPLKYFENKQQYLQNISNLNRGAIVQNNQIPLLSLVNSKHKQLQNQLKQKKLEELKYLNPNHFDSIFDDPEKVNIKLLNIFKLNHQQELKQFYYSEFIEKPQLEIVKQKEIELKEENKQVALFGVVENLKKTNAKISKEKQEQSDNLRQIQQELQQIKIQAEQVKYKPTELCKNIKLISKLSGSLMSYYTVYFKEITDKLIDDILLDEIQYLNEKDSSLFFGDDDEQWKEEEEVVEETPIKKSQMIQEGTTNQKAEVDDFLHSDLKQLAERFKLLIDD